MKEKEDNEFDITRELQDVKEKLQIQSNTKDSLAEKLQNASSQHERLIQVSTRVMYGKLFSKHRIFVGPRAGEDSAQGVDEAAGSYVCRTGETEVY